MPTLTILTGANAGVYFELGNREILLGRESTCDIIISSRTVSRQHARVLRTSEGWCLEDLGSVNGTYVNGERINGRRLLADRDRIRIHNVALGYHNGPPDQGMALFTETEQSETVMAENDSKAEQRAIEEASSRIVCAIDVRPHDREELAGNLREKLRAVVEITRSVGASLETEQILPRILESMLRIFPQAEHGYILRAAGPASGSPATKLTVWASQHRHEDEEGKADTLGPIGSQIVRRVLAERTAFLTRDVMDDSRLEDLQTCIHNDDRARSVICAPLMAPSRRVFGVIYLEAEDAQRPFVQQDLDVLVSVAILAAQSIENVDTHQALLDLDRRKREMRMARKVQLCFLPSQRPEPPGYHFFDYYHPAESVGGDFYDYIQLPDNRVAVAMGDVVGKGVSAALMTARLYAEVRYCLLATASPAEALARLNQIWLTRAKDATFVTVLLSVLDPARHEVAVARAGHPPPLVRRVPSRLVEELAPNCGGLPIGVKPDVSYKQAVVNLEPGDMVICYTDGVSEAMNHWEQMFGLDAMRKTIAQCDDDVTHVVKMLVGEVRQFVGGEPQSDDICVVAAGRAL